MGSTTEHPVKREKRLFIIVTVLLLFTSVLMIKAHGAYDAWLQWNSLARYMSDPAYFKFLARPDSIWHADYPPGLPSLVGFFWRILGYYPEWIPRSFSFLFYLSLVLILCRAALQVRALPLLMPAVLLIFAVNFECLSQGLNQYADVPLSLMLLLVLLLLDQYELDPNPALLYLVGLFLGACMLLKNEGILMAVCVLLVYAKYWLSARSAVYLLIGMAPCLIVVFVYKKMIPEANDLIQNFDAGFWELLLDGSRYQVILERAIRVIGGRYPLPLAFTFWTLWKLRKHSGFWKSRKLAVILLCFSGFLFTYLTTSYDIVWLTNTSFNRLIMQLLPAFIYFLMDALARYYSAPRSPRTER